MRRKSARRLMVALGKAPFTKTREMSETVEALVFNGCPEARIAAGLGLDLFELRYHFADELVYSQDRLLAKAMKNVQRIADQTNELGYALEANKLMLRTHSPAWREPKQVEPEATAAIERVETLSLDEVEAELAKLGKSEA